jgi:transposase
MNVRSWRDKCAQNRPKRRKTAPKRINQRKTRTLEPFRRKTTGQTPSSQTVFAGVQLDIAPSTATRIVKDWRQTGSYKVGKRGGRRPFLLWPFRDRIEQLVSQHPDWSEAAYGAYLAEHFGVHMHPTSVGRFIRLMGWRYKKNGFRLRADEGRDRQGP